MTAAGRIIPAVTDLPYPPRIALARTGTLL